MAKPLSLKSKVIRHALAAHLQMGNKALAERLNGDPAHATSGVTVKASDVAQQKQALKATGFTHGPTAAAEQKRRGRKPGSKNKPRAVAPAAARVTAGPVLAPAAVSPVDLIDRVFVLAEQCGGMGQLRRLVEKLAGA